mmetsp:Transcript_9728/g.14575  ORF Transcript_9728/g.14575 Transcript_9728/m.14575 type:complete len:92 (+) Transcript_9728:1093-1368(+)
MRHQQKENKKSRGKARGGGTKPLASRTQSTDSTISRSKNNNGSTPSERSRKHRVPSLNSPSKDDVGLRTSMLERDFATLANALDDISDKAS